MKSPGPLPTIVREIAVEGKDIAGVEPICHGDQAGIGEICWSIAVFIEDSLNFACADGELKRNLKCSAGNVCQDVFRGTVDFSQ